MNSRKVFVQRFQFGKNFQQRTRWRRLNDQAFPFFPQNSVLGRKFELAGNPYRLVSSILEDSDVPFRIRLGFWHMLSICEVYYFFKD